MEIFYDGLIFDDRSTDFLFDKDHSKQPFYADVLKRWVVGYALNEGEERIVANILIYYPEYVLQNGKTEGFLNLINDLLHRAGLQKADDPEKGLWLYTLLYFMIITGAKDKWLPVYTELKNVFSDHEAPAYAILDSLDQDDLTGLLSSGGSASNTSKHRIARGYIEIILRILDLKEMLLFPQYFDLAEFPLPRINSHKYDLWDLRQSAFTMYSNGQYREAFNIYKFLRIARFELPGTLVHMVRVQLALDNIEQAELYAAMAWRNRKMAEKYVTGRILFAIVFVNMLQSKPFAEWLGCLKYLLTLPDNYSFLFEWDMDRVMEQYQPRLNEKQVILMRRILLLTSHHDIAKKLDDLSLWKNTLPVTKDKWPEYEIAAKME